MKILRLIALLLILTPVFAQSPCQPVLHWRSAITPTEIREYLSYSHNLDEWLANVERIKALNSGALPVWWKREIIESQYFDGLRRSWGTGLAQEKRR